MVAALNQHRACRTFVASEMAEVSHSLALGVTRIGHDSACDAQVAHEFDVPRLHARQQECGALLVHGVQVEQIVRVFQPRPQFSSTTAFDARTVGKPIRAPLAIEILFDKAGRVLILLIKPGEGKQVAECQGQPPAT